MDELRSMPKLSGLDVSRNPLRCDEQLTSAIQWLTEHNVTPTESLHVLGGPKVNDPYDGFGENVNQWMDLAKRICDKWDGGPVSRPSPRKVPKKTNLNNKVKDSPISLPGPFLKKEENYEQVCC